MISSKSAKSVLVTALGLGLLSIMFAAGAPRGQALSQPMQEPSRMSEPIAAHAVAMVDAGRRTFRFDTFGDEEFWVTPSGCTGRSQAPQTGASVRG